MSHKQRGHGRDRKAKPYHPDMKSYSVDNIEAFVRQCEVWDDIKDDCFTLDTGEIITVTDFYKYFGKPTHHVNLTQYWVNGDIISQYVSMRNENSSSSGSYGKKNNTEQEQKTLNQIHKFMQQRRRMSEAVPILTEISSTSYEFPSYVAGPVPQFTVQVSDLVSFGDFMDAQKLEPRQKEVDGAIQHINTCRPFLPRTYMVCLITPVADSSPLLIFHHEKVDPRKIVHRVFEMAEDYGEPYHRNICNVVEWFAWRNWGADDSDEGTGDEDVSDEDVKDVDDVSDEDGPDHKGKKLSDKQVSSAVHKDDNADKLDESDDSLYCSLLNITDCDSRLNKHRNTIYFTPTEHAPNLATAVKSEHVKRSKHLSTLYRVLGQNNQTISLAVDSVQYHCGDWVYGKAFQDRSTERYFALVADFGLDDDLFDSIPQEAKDKFPSLKFSSVKETKLIFDVSDFH